MTTGEKIKKRRIELEWSQRDLAEKMGYNHSTITRIESGKIGISQTRIIQFSKVLGVSVAYLMGYEDYTDKEDAEIIKSLGHINPKEELPPEIEAVNTLLYSHGLAITKANGEYFFDEAGKLTEEELNEFLNTVTTMVHSFADALIKKKTNQVKDFFGKNTKDIKKG